MLRHFLIVLLTVFSAAVFAAPGSDYKLGAGDVVKITVWDHADLSVETQLTKDGEVNFPLIGLISLNGLSVAAAENALASVLRSAGYIVKPSVSILVTQYVSHRFTILGEVNKPGRYPLDSQTSLLDALAIATGVTPSAGDTVLLTRDNTQVTYSVAQLAGESDPDKRNIWLKAGDVLFIPRSQVFVLGEVQRPGNFRLEPGMTVMQAISVAGGFSSKASHSSIKITRKLADGSSKEMKSVSLSDALSVNDVVYVEESWF